MIKLHLGCGGSMYGIVDGIDASQFGGTAREWINIDANLDPEMITRVGADELIHGYPRALACDFRKLPFPDNFADVAYSHHSFEHIRIDEALPTLREWHRVLKPGGIAYICVPDLLWVAQQLCRTGGDLLWSEMGERTGDWETGYTKLIHCIFGDQSNDTFQLHKTGFTERSLRRQMEESGFQNIQIRHIADMGMTCLESMATK